MRNPCSAAIRGYSPARSIKQTITSGDIEWQAVIRDLDRLEEVDVTHRGKTFRLRTEAKGVAGKVCQAVGVALPPTIQEVA